jgi:hypothetical protein
MYSTNVQSSMFESDHFYVNINAGSAVSAEADIYSSNYFRITSRNRSF